MVHLRPLPGAPRFDGDRAAVQDAALADARAYAEGGAAGLILENFGDVPFTRGRVGAEVVAAMTAVACHLGELGLPLGINVLRNDGLSALAVAAAAGAAFVRVNILTGARLTDQGLIEGIGHELLRERKRIGAESVEVWADVDVKHSTPLGPVDLGREASETLGRGGAEALIVTGPATGAGVETGTLRCVRAAAPEARIWVGSGVCEDNVAACEAADGFIVGSSLKRGGRPDGRVEAERVRRLVAAIGDMPPLDF